MIFLLQKIIHLPLCDKITFSNLIIQEVMYWLLGYLKVTIIDYQ